MKTQMKTLIRSARTVTLALLLSMLAVSMVAGGAAAADASNTTSISEGDSWQNEYDRIDSKMSETTVTGQYVYIADSEYVYKYNKSTGERMWQSGTAINTVDWGTTEDVPDSPTVRENTVIVNDVSTYDVVAFNTSDGTERWRVGVSDTRFDIINSSVITIDAGVESINISDGTTEWTTEINSQDESFVLADSNRVYSAGQSNNVTALDAETGNITWQHSPSDSYTSSDIIELFNDEKNDNVIVEGFNDDRTWALNKSTGVQEWSEGGELQGITVEDGAMVFERSSSVHLIDTDTGKTKWSNSSVDGVTRAEITDDAVYVSDYDISALDRSNGTVMWEYQRGDYVLAENEDDGVLFAGENEGSKLVAIDSDTGNELWNYSVPGLIVESTDIEAVEDGNWLFTGATDTNNATASVLAFDTAALNLEPILGGGGEDDATRVGDGDFGGGVVPLAVVLVAGVALFLRFRDE